MSWRIIYVNQAGGCGFVWRCRRPVQPVRFHSRKAAKRWLRRDKRARNTRGHYLIINWSKRL
ncbi:hypothetical protein [Pseudomonas phage PJNP013]|uniref:Uncharacterized protein n=1 Tax=Pseudomonas phage PJNP013 TaxID=3108093 RepID=A0ABZ2CMB8_9CAUD